MVFPVHSSETNATASFVVLLSADLYSLNDPGQQFALKMLEAQYKKMPHEKFLSIVEHLPNSFFYKSHPCVIKWILQKPISQHAWRNISPSLHSQAPFDLVAEYIKSGFSLLENHASPLKASDVLSFLEQQAQLLTLNPAPNPSSSDLSGVVKSCVSYFQQKDSMGYACHFFALFPPPFLSLTLKELKKQGHQDVAQAVVQLTKLQKAIKECVVSPTTSHAKNLEALLKKLSPLSKQAVLLSPGTWSSWMLEASAFSTIDLIHKAIKNLAPQIWPSVVSMDMMFKALPFVLPDKQQCFDLVSKNTTKSQKKEALSAWICCLPQVEVSSWTSVMTWIKQGKKWNVKSSSRSKIDYHKLAEVMSKPLSLEDKKNIEKALSFVADMASPSFCFAMDLSCQVLGLSSPWQGQSLKPCPVTVWDEERECFKVISPQFFLKASSGKSFEAFAKSLMCVREKACLNHSLGPTHQHEKKPFKERKKM